MKPSQKEQKRTRKKKKKCAGLRSSEQSSATHWTVRCAPNSPVHGPANYLLLEILACIGYKSLDRPHVAPDSSVCQPPTASYHVGRGPMIK
jgi:hypothetical protein